MNKKEITQALFKIAGEMANKKKMPSPYEGDWSFSKYTPKYDKLKVIIEAEGAHDQCNEWSYRLRQLIDLLNK